MTDRTAAELEHDAEIARAKISDTAESIRSKMSPGQLMDEFTGLFSGGDGSKALSNLKNQVRDNPLPIALVGAGLAWLMLGQGAASASPRAPAATTPLRRPDLWGSEGMNDDKQDGVTSGSGTTGGAVSDALHSLGSTVDRGVKAGKDYVAGAAEQVSQTGMNYGSAASEKASKAANSAQDLLGREPIAVAALGIAIGAAIGSLLPHTAIEDQHMGQLGDKVRKNVADLADKGMEAAKEVAAESYQTLKDEADRSGLKPGETPIVEKVSDVLKATAAKTEDAVKDRLAEAREPSSGV